MLISNRKEISCDSFHQLFANFAEVLDVAAARKRLLKKVAENVKAYIQGKPMNVVK